MTISTSQILTFIGLGFAVVAGFGSHLITHFSGRALESYCRLKRKRERYGEILDLQDRAATSAEYVFLFGMALAGVSGTLWAVQRTEASSEAESTLMSRVWLGPALIVAVSAISVLFRDWLPRLAVRNGAAVILFHTWPWWKAITRLTTPLAALADFFDWIGIRLTDESESEDFEEESFVDEVQTLVASGEREGYVARGVREMIQGVMKLEEATVAQIMTPRSMVDSIDASLPLSEIFQKVTEFGRTRLPVYEQSPDNIIGILFVKDLFSLVDGVQSRRSSIRDILREVWHIPGARKVNELLRDFLHKRNHMAVVVDDYHQFIGVVTIEDALEEIVGEIADELDVDEESIIRIDESTGEVEAEGRATIDQINRAMGWELPISDDYDTIAGLVIHQLGEIPSEGKSIEIEHIRIVVLRANSRQIRRVKLLHVLQEAAENTSGESRQESKQT